MSEAPAPKLHPTILRHLERRATAESHKDDRLYHAPNAFYGANVAPKLDVEAPAFSPPKPEVKEAIPKTIHQNGQEYVLKDAAKSDDSLCAPDCTCLCCRCAWDPTKTHVCKPFIKVIVSIALAGALLYGPILKIAETQQEVYACRALGGQAREDCLVDGVAEIYALWFCALFAAFAILIIATTLIWTREKWNLPMFECVNCKPNFPMGVLLLIPVAFLWLWLLVFCGVISDHECHRRVSDPLNYEYCGKHDMGFTVGAIFTGLAPMLIPLIVGACVSIITGDNK